jgi:hypothetical protein
MSVSRTEACCSAFANHSPHHPRQMGSKEVNTYLIFFSNLEGWWPVCCTEVGCGGWKP